MRAGIPLEHIFSFGSIKAPFLVCPNHKSQIAKSLIINYLLTGSCVGEGLLHFPLIEESFFRLEGSGVDHSNLFAIGAIHGEYSSTADRHSQVEEPRLD